MSAQVPTDLRNANAVTFEALASEVEPFPPSLKGTGSIDVFVTAGNGQIEDKNEDPEEAATNTCVRCQARPESNPPTQGDRVAARPTYDGMITFESAHTNRTWEIHASSLVPESDTFAKIHRFGTQDSQDSIDPEDPCAGVRSLARLGPQRYQLIEVTDACFKDFLRGVKPRLCQENTQTRFRNILILATDWGFEGLRNIAIRNITAHMLSPRTPFSTRLGDLDLFLLAHRTRVSSWLPISHTYFVTKIAPLSAVAISALGPRVTAAIDQARVEVRKRRLALVAPDTPPEWVSGWFKHTDCWQALGDCWKRVLNDADAVRPRVALLEELTVQRGSTTTTRKFCDGCFEKAKNGMLNDWLQLKKDEKIAEEVLIAVLGDDLDAWLDL